MGFASAPTVITAPIPSRLRHSAPRALLLIGLLLALPAWATIDRNSDGISDIWAGLHPTAGSPESDPDGDGTTNRSEALAGTNPLSASSRLTSTPQRDPAGNLVLTWPSVAGKHYQIESSADLIAWAAFSNQRPGTGADLSEIVSPAGVAAPARQFWRVYVSDTDTDSDDLNNWEEAQLGTSPTVADTDSDGLTDGWEVANGTDPKVANVTPVFSTQPQNASVFVGQTATFTVSATSDGPLSYQWLRNGAPVAGARFTNYTTPIASLTDDNTAFGVVVTDGAGVSILSTTARLTVTVGARRTQHYVDPVAGTAAGDGSAARPWLSLQDVIDHQVETRTWEAPLPYTEGKNLVPVNPAAPVRAGDTIWLRPGDYGALVIRSAYNSAPITIAAEAGGVPRFSNVLVQSSQYWILRGFAVSPSYAATYSRSTIVTVENHNWRGPAYDIVIDGFDIFSVPDEAVWPLASDWDTKAANGLSTSAARTRVSHCRLRNTNFALAMEGRGSRAEYNTIDGFSGDGLRGLGDDEVFEYNLVKNRRNVNTNHPDGFQSWSVGTGGVGTGVVRNVTLRGNVFIAYESPSIPFAGTIQGIGCFDGTYEGWIVENNVVITTHYHGISLYGARHSRIVNNTVVDLDQSDIMTPWILVTAHKKERRARTA